MRSSVSPARARLRLGLFAAGAVTWVANPTKSAYTALIVVGAIFPLGMMHYLLWGRAFESQTEGDREEAHVLDRAREELQHRTWTPRS